MAARKRRRKKNFWAPGPVARRMAFGTNGPTRKAVAKGIRNTLNGWFGPQTIASVAHDPATQKRVKKVLSVDPKTGVITPVTPAGKSGKKAASKPSRASTPSKPSRAGQVQRRAAAAPSPEKQQRVKSQAERAEERRRPDGKFDGSTPAVDPFLKAQQDYEQALRRAARLERITDRDLGWGQRDRGM